MKNYSYSFNASVEQILLASFTEEEYQDFSEEGETREEYARRRAMEDAPRRITMRIADDGVSEESINVEGLEDKDVWETED